jgi:aryl-alcohol dehydrogenase-like predicted oxidoreductase
VDGLREFAESRGHTLLELAMSWLASKSVIASIIAGAKTPDQVKANASSVNWRLTEADLAALNGILTPVA